MSVETGDGGGGGAVMVSNQDIAEALETLIRNNPSITSFSGIVQYLEAKLGFDLTDKIDFIRCHIQFLLQRQTQHCPILPVQYETDYYALPQNAGFQFQPNIYVSPLVSHFGFQSPRFSVTGPQQYAFQAPPPQQTQVVAPLPPPTSSVDAEASKDSAQSGKKRKGGSGGLYKACGVSPELQAIVGQETMSRTEIVKQLWAYIRKHNLQDPTNKKKIICNDELRVLFETDCTDMFKMNKLLAKHILPLEPSKLTAQNAKKAKTVVESRAEGTNSVPIFLISEALANFFRTDVKEMSQAEILRQTWEYIKIHQLEDPLNSMAIICDGKLQDLFGCQSISAFGIQEMLSQLHMFKKT